MTAPAPPVPRWHTEPTVDADIAPEGLIAADCHGDADDADGMDGVDLPDADDMAEFGPDADEEDPSDG